MNFTRNEILHGVKVSVIFFDFKFDSGEKRSKLSQSSQFFLQNKLLRVKINVNVTDI